jgi:hypothetical protein
MNIYFSIIIGRPAVADGAQPDGGAATPSGLIATEAVARTTRDVDVVALEEDGELVSAEPLPRAVRDAAKIVARDLALEPDWLNSGPTGLLVHGLPAGFAGRLTARDFGTALRVSFASRIDQAFLKALCRGRPPRATRLCGPAAAEADRRGTASRRAVGTFAQHAGPVRRCHGPGAVRSRSRG